MKLYSTMQYYMMHCMNIHLWIVTFKSIIKRSTASFCSLLTGNFVLSAEMAALVADYNADVKERDVKGILLKMLPSLYICLVMYIADYFWTLKKTLHGTVQKLCFLHLAIFSPAHFFSYRMI